MKMGSIHISIPKPCHESWAEMKTTDKGAFCNACQKQVIDLSAMTDREVIEYLARNQTGCGRFRKDQVDTMLVLAKKDNGYVKWRAAFFSLLSLINLRDAVAQTNSEKTIQNKAPIVQSVDSTKCNQVYSIPEVKVIAYKKPIIDDTQTGEYTSMSDMIKPKFSITDSLKRILQH